MKALVCLLFIVRYASGAAVELVPLDTAVVKSNRVGNNFAYSVHENRGYGAVVAPTVVHNAVAAPTLIHGAAPSVVHGDGAPVLVHQVPIVPYVATHSQTKTTNDVNAEQGDDHQQLHRDVQKLAQLHNVYQPLQHGYTYVQTTGPHYAYTYPYVAYQPLAYNFIKAT